MSSGNGRLITFFKSCRASTGEDGLVEYFFEKVRQGVPEFLPLIEEIRKENDHDKRQGLKKKLPGVCLSGTFNKRKNEGLKTHSGLIAIDIDGVKNPEEMKKKILSDEILSPIILAVFVSASGAGLCVVFCIDGERHLDSFKYFENYFMEKFTIQVDKAAKDIARFRYLSFDPHIYCNLHAETFVIPNADSEVRREHKSTGNGSNKTWNWKFMEALIVSGISIGIDNYDTWLRYCFGLATEFKEAGRELFHELSRLGAKYDAASCDAKYSEVLKNNKGDVTFASIVHMAGEAGFVYPDSTNECDPPREETKQKKKRKKFEPIKFGDFWGVDEDGNTELFQMMMLNFLEETGGFHRYRPSQKDFGYVYIQINNNLVKEIRFFEFKDFIMNYLRKKMAKG